MFLTIMHNFLSGWLAGQYKPS